MAKRGFIVKKEIIINSPAENVWEMVGPGFTNVHHWASNVDHAMGKGTSSIEGASCDVRHCQVSVKGFDKISERLTDYNNEDRTLTYEVINGMPGFIALAQNKWKVAAKNEGQSILMMEAEFQLKGVIGLLMKRIMKGKMSDTLDIVLNDAKYYAEHGTASPAKLRRLEKIRKKVA